VTSSIIVRAAAIWVLYTGVCGRIVIENLKKIEKWTSKKFLHECVKYSTRKLCFRDGIRRWLRRTVVTRYNWGRWGAAVQGLVWRSPCGRWQPRSSPVEAASAIFSCVRHVTRSFLRSWRSKPVPSRILCISFDGVVDSLSNSFNAAVNTLLTLPLDSDFSSLLLFALPCPSAGFSAQLGYADDSEMVRTISVDGLCSADQWNVVVLVVAMSTLSCGWSRHRCASNS